MARAATKIIALAQGKGGVAKSTTAINLACEATHSGESAAILDMDEKQQSSKLWSKRRKGSSPEVSVVNVYGLKRELDRLREKGVGWVFIDLPGRDAPVSSAGIIAADFVLIPTRPTTIDFEASVPTAGACFGAGKSYAYLLSSVQPQGGKSIGRQFRAALEMLPKPPPVCPILIGQRVAIPRSTDAGKSVREMDLDKEATKEFEDLFKWLKRVVR